MLLTSFDRFKIKQIENGDRFCMLFPLQETLETFHLLILRGVFNAFIGFSYNKNTWYTNYFLKLYLLLIDKGALDFEYSIILWN